MYKCFIHAPCKIKHFERLIYFLICFLKFNNRSIYNSTECVYMQTRFFKIFNMKWACTLSKQWSSVFQRKLLRTYDSFKWKMYSLILLRWWCGYVIIKLLYHISNNFSYKKNGKSSIMSYIRYIILVVRKLKCFGAIYFLSSK